MVNVVVRKREEPESLRELIERRGGNIIYEQLGPIHWRVECDPDYFNKNGYGTTPLEAAQNLVSRGSSSLRVDSYYDAGINEDPELIRACAKGEK